MGRTLVDGELHCPSDRSPRPREDRLSRPRLNLYLDALALLGLVGTVVTGLVLRLVLPPGSGRLEVGDPERPLLTLWGFTRQEWGGFHYATSLGLLSILSLHLWLHRDWIASMGKRESKASGKLFALGLTTALAWLVVMLSPLCSQPVERPRSEVLAQRGQPLSSATVCYDEGVALSAFDLERLTGVPEDRFLAAQRPLSSRETREIIEAHYAAPPTDRQGADLYTAHCFSCHGKPSSLPDFGEDDGAALERLREAKPSGPHQRLRSLSDEQLTLLLAYLRAARHEGGRAATVE